jgi:hypothetical protein
MAVVENGSHSVMVGASDIVSSVMISERNGQAKTESEKTCVLTQFDAYYFRHSQLYNGSDLVFW